MHEGVLVANKVDLTERRKVGGREGEAFATTKELEYFECSAVSEANLQRGHQQRLFSPPTERA